MQSPYALFSFLFSLISFLLFVLIFVCDLRFFHKYSSVFGRKNYRSWDVGRDQTKYNRSKWWCDYRLVDCFSFAAQSECVQCFPKSFSGQTTNYGRTYVMNSATKKCTTEIYSRFVQASGFTYNNNSFMKLFRIRKYENAIFMGEPIIPREKKIHSPSLCQSIESGSWLEHHTRIYL